MKKKSAENLAIPSVLVIDEEEDDDKKTSG